MKKKFYPLWACALLISSGIVVTGMLVKRSEPGARPAPPAPVVQIAAIKVPDPEVLDEMERLTARMGAIAYPKPGMSPTVGLELFGYEPLRESRIGARGKRVVLKPRIHYLITMAFSAGKQRFCVVDGTFYPEGARLADGARIVRVEYDRVLMEKGRIRNWVPVAGRRKEASPKPKSTGEKP